MTTSRRDLLALLASTAAMEWPGSVWAQQGKPRIGYLSALSKDRASHLTDAVRQGLSDAGFPEGTKVEIEYRWADGQYDRLPALATELVRRPVDLIFAQSPPAAIAARTATTTVPIVFVVGVDPVAAGLVASFSRPGGNATGMTLITGPLGQKRLEFLRELAPDTAVVATLLNPLSPDAAPEMRDVQQAAQAMGIEIKIFHASTPSEIGAAFAALVEQRPQALLLASDPFFMDRRDQITVSAEQLRIPAIYPFREFTQVGGLLSYGTNIANTYRRAGTYAGRILNGEKPADLPVEAPTIFELVINLKTARTLGLTIPPTLLARADEVIE
jgi:ABC-type uncharacterized transport system substrate-binding protein